MHFLAESGTTGSNGGTALIAAVFFVLIVVLLVSALGWKKFLALDAGCCLLDSVGCLGVVALGTSAAILLW